MPTKTCSTCDQPIKTCEECGGLMCAPGCKDRLEDGCVCESDMPEEGEADDMDEEN